MSPTPNFHIRGLREGLEDGEFMIAAYDASLAQLASIGSGGQWGTTPLSERGDMDARIKIFEQARRYQTTGEGDPIRIFVIEAEIGDTDEVPAAAHVRTDDVGKKFLAVGSVMLSEGLYPYYLRPHFEKESIKKELDGTKDYIYVEALITDYRTGSWRKGSGAALLDHAQRFCRERGQSILYLDAYAGNDKKLLKYYEGQGYSVVDDFVSTKPDGSTWHGALLRLDLV
ncbi:acetyltransferase [Xylaria cf. heliscus]|nr:acetyltransferase [Xylaria cf. heliscus]